MRTFWLPVAAFGFGCVMALLACGTPAAVVQPVSAVPAANSTLVASSEPADPSLADALKELCAHLHFHLHGEKRAVRIAVLPFLDADGHEIELGHYAADRIVTTLTGRRGLQFVERERLNQVTGELNLVASGLMSDQNVVSVGQLSGAQMLIVGSLTNLGSAVEVNCRLVDAETGKVVYAVALRFRRDATVDGLWKRRDAERTTGGGVKTGSGGHEAP